MSAAEHTGDMTDDDADALARLQADVADAEATWESAIGHRDAMIRTLRRTERAGVTEMARVTGLGRRYVHKILKGAP